MATYAIGDIQGCYEPLQKLLETIKFDNKKDTLWFTGDLVNRGPNSLEVLRFVSGLGDKHKVVLGNHDLHALSVVFGVSELNEGDTIHDLLLAPDRGDLIDWLRSKPLFYFDAKHQTALVHAGIAPMWTIGKALRLSHEVEEALQGHGLTEFFENMYGNEPACWSNELAGIDRLRCIVNYFTRMRLCYSDGTLDFSFKGKPEDKPDDLKPWFELPHKFDDETKVIFGHWAALKGNVQADNLVAIDTGCVWGESLTAYCLDDGQRYTAPGKPA